MKSRRRTRFVPRMLLATACVGVVPACVGGCSGSGQPDMRYHFFDVAIFAFDLSVPPEEDLSAVDDMGLPDDAAIADATIDGPDGHD